MTTVTTRLDKFEYQQLEEIRLQLQRSTMIKMTISQTIRLAIRFTNDNITDLLRTTNNDTND